MSKICGNCGTQLPDEARFCTECGGNVLEVRQAAGNDGGSFAGYNTSVVAGNGSLCTDQSAGHGETYADAGCYDESAPKKKKIGLIVTIILTALLLGATAIALFVWPGFLCKKGIDGVWTSVRGGFSLEFNDGKATVHTEDGKEDAVFSCTQDGDKIKLNGDDGDFEYEFKIRGNALTIYYDEGGRKYPEAYTRKGTETPEERKVIGRWKANDDELVIDDDTIVEIHDDGNGEVVDSYTYTSDGSTFTITPDDPDKAPFVHIIKEENGELVIRGEDGVSVIVVLLQNGGSEFFKKATRDALTGRWIDESGAPLRFENGEAISDSSLGKFTCKYIIDDNKLTLLDGNENEIETLAFTLDGDVLTLVRTFGDGTKTEFVFTRVDAKLLGSWADENGVLCYSFCDDGTGFDGDEQFCYKTINGVICLLDNRRNPIGIDYQYNVDGDVLTLIIDSNVERYYRSGTAKNDQANDDVRVVEASHIVEEVPDWPGDPNAKREYSIPELRCSGENVAEFNRTIREKCQSDIDFVSRSENSGVAARIEYSYSIDNGVVAISVSTEVVVAYSDVGHTKITIYYFDYANDGIISDWKEYLGRLGYQADTMEKAVLKTDRLIEFATPSEGWSVWDIKLIGIIIGGTDSTVVIDYSYSNELGSGTTSYDLSVPTSQLLNLYEELNGNKGNSSETASSDFTGDDACYLDKLKNFKKDYEDMWSDMGYDTTVSSVYYCLRDINGDGVNELVISENGDGIDALYTRVGRNVIELYIQGRHGGVGVTSDGYIYESYKYLDMYKLQQGELVEVYSLDLNWDCDDPYEDLEKRSNEEREKRGISKTDMEFDYKKYL